VIGATVVVTMGESRWLGGPVRVHAMEDDITPKARPASPKAPSTSEPSEGELSRIAREAVRQPPDPRLEKQLAWMGLGDAPLPAERQQARAEPADPQPPPRTGVPGAIGATTTDLEPLRAQLRRLELIVWALVGLTAVLAVLVLVLLVR
jgi:hypothetical protein